MTGFHDEPRWVQSGPVQLAQGARSCKQVSSCEEAVELWCGGYRRADGDGDGIPCENVCSSKEEVDRIREEIGC
ncbi:excalibur calcium-binding domain-containing protein [Aquamicrobium sp. LC103]|uniref:excalibur calcium-binding domain-containing protein n=1 Tax=Aquamicrobium sp. LC103 TaxID=1120658 RepID=UPI00063E93D2|nr:excalibur calcium-binding domain-containing protein [Aquamicrobium sp. LC103]TKT83056.1 excalibur calcium-binding domain-containing protein [Aquamicrobium sp. LC103]